MESIFTAIFEKVDDWYIKHLEELAGAKQDKTLEEAQGESTRSYRVDFQANKIRTKNKKISKVLISTIFKIYFRGPANHCPPPLTQSSLNLSVALSPV
jgi:hypothetical protein